MAVPRAPDSAEAAFQPLTCFFFFLGRRTRLPTCVPFKGTEVNLQCNAIIAQVISAPPQNLCLRMRARALALPPLVHILQSDPPRAQNVFIYFFPPSSLLCIYVCHKQEGGFGQLPSFLAVAGGFK